MVFYRKPHSIHATTQAGYAQSLNSKHKVNLLLRGGLNCHLHNHKYMRNLQRELKSQKDPATKPKKRKLKQDRATILKSKL